MEYKINIFFKGKLLFATDPATTKTIDELQKLFNVLNPKFPQEEGYSLDVCLSVLKFSRAAWLGVTNPSSQIIIVLKH